MGEGVWLNQRLHIEINDKWNNGKWSQKSREVRHSFCKKEKWTLHWCLLKGWGRYPQMPRGWKCLPTKICIWRRKPRTDFSKIKTCSIWICMWDALWWLWYLQMKAAIIGMVLSQLLFLLEVMLITENPSAEHAKTMASRMNEKHLIKQQIH